ncbi:MAG: hypothetical protein ACYCYD_13445, partial [Acidimicrobiales bacterium]
MSSGDKALGLRRVCAMLAQPGHVAPGECGVVPEPAFELRDPGGPAAEGVGNRLEADASAQACRTEIAAGRDCFG